MSSRPDGSLIRERLPYSGRSIDEVLNSVRNALSVKGTQRILLDKALDYIRIERFPQPGEPTTGPGMSFNDAVRQLEHLAEYIPEDDKKSSYQQLFEMFMMVADEKLDVCCILTGPRAPLHSWVKVPRRTTTLLGVPVHRIEELPDTSIIVCGAEVREAEPEDILFAVKGELP